MKIQAADQSLLGVAHAVGQVLDYPDSKLSEVVKTLRSDASSLLVRLAEHLREPNLDVSAFLTDLREGAVSLLAKAIEAGEDPENEIAFMVQNAKNNLADLLEYYADQVQGESDLKKLLTHPALTVIAKATLEAVGAAK